MISQTYDRLSDDEVSAQRQRERSAAASFAAEEQRRRELFPFGGGSRIDDLPGLARRQREEAAAAERLSHEQLLALPSTDVVGAAAALRGAEERLERVRVHLAHAANAAAEAKAGADTAACDVGVLERAATEAEAAARVAVREGRGIAIDPSDYAPRVVAGRRRAEVLAEVAREARAALDAAEGEDAARAAVDTARTAARWSAWSALMHPLVEELAAGVVGSFAVLSDEERSLAARRILHAVELRISK